VIASIFSASIIGGLPPCCPAFRRGESGHHPLAGQRTLHTAPARRTSRTAARRAALVVSIASVSERKAMPRARKSVIIDRRCGGDARASRASTPPVCRLPSARRGQALRRDDRRARRTPCRHGCDAHPTPAAISASR
jgi:hypothetical protein